MDPFLIITFFCFCVDIVSGTKQVSLSDAEDGIDAIVGRKVSEMCNDILKDHDRKFELQEKILQDYERKFQAHEQLLLDQTQKFAKQEQKLHEYQHKVMHLATRLDMYNAKHAFKNGSLAKTLASFGAQSKVTSGLKDNYQTTNANDISNNQILKKRVFSTGQGVAFNAQLTGPRSNIGIGQAIKFDRVHLNDGNAYNSHTGIFTAPQSGVYMFAYFFAHAGASTGQAWLRLMHDGKTINAAVSDISDRWQDTQGGNFAFIRLTSGNSVWIESWHEDDAFIDGIDGFTTFSGALLY